MIGVLTWIAAAFSVAWAGSLPDAEEAVRAAPFDTEARVAYAEALARVPGREEEAAEALLLLLDAREDALARATLGELVRRVPAARPGWARVYLVLAAGPPGPAREAGRVRALELRAADPKTRARALRDLAASTDPLAMRVLGDHHLRAGYPARAAAAWERAGDVARDRRALLEALEADPVEGARALAAAGFEEAAERVLVAIVGADMALPDEGAGATPGGTPRSVPSGVAAEPLRRPAAGGPTDAGEETSNTTVPGPPAPPAGHLAPGAGDGAGGGTGAREGTGTGEGTGTTQRPAAALLLSALRLARGDGEGALRAATTAAALAPSPATHAARIRALLALGRADEAAALLSGPELEAAERAALEVTLVLARARVTPSLDDDLPAAAAAFAAAPDEVDTAGFYARALLAAERPAEAVAPLARAAALRPEDGALLGQRIDAALRAGDPTRALAAATEAAARAPDPAARAAALDGIAGLLLATAEAERKAGDRAAASSTALVALAIRPELPFVERAVGGALWGEGRLDGAYALYARAAARDPADRDANRAAAALAYALGRRAEAEARLATLPADDPEVRALRDELDRADAFAAASAHADRAAAEAAWNAAAVRWPDDARFLHGLADARLAAGRAEEARALQEQAVARAPADPWNRLGLAQALLALDRPDEALAALDGLDALPAPLSGDAAAQRDRLRAAGLRARADTARAAGDLPAAIDAYRAAHALDPDVWTTLSLSGALVSRGEYAEALAGFRAALASHGGEAAVDTVATRGEAGALEAMGHGDAALGTLDALAARRPDPETDALRAALQARTTVRRADALRREGALVAARSTLASLGPAAAETPIALSARAALLLDLDRAPEAIDAATRALLTEPTNPWALDVARLAGRACACSARVVPLFEAAAASGPGPEAQAAGAALPGVRLSAALEAAAAARGDPLAAARPLAQARRLAGDDPALLLSLAEAARDQGRYGRADAALRAARRVAPDSVEVLLATAADRARRGQRRAAIRMLEARWATDRDPRVGALLARIRALGPPLRVRAARVPARTPTAAPDLDPEVDAAERAALAEEAAREGAPEPDGSDGEPDGEDLDGEDLDGEDRPEDADSDPLEDLTPDDAPTFGPREVGTRAGPKPPRPDAPDRPPALAAAVGVGFLARSGVAGIGQELATYVPIHLGPAPVGPVRFDIEAVLTRVEDGVNTAWGVAPAIGAATPLHLPWAAWLRVGTSPIGFADTPTPVWFLGGRGRVALPLAIGVETGRAPVLDSLTSWAGGADLFSGDPIGRVHHTWFGGWASAGAPWGGDIGVLGRLGQSEGIALPPVGRVELVAWLGQRIGTPTRNVRLGAESVAFSHEAQVDGFQVGQGAFYSPPIFATATGRLDVRWTAFSDRLAVCGGVGAGVQYAGGAISPWFVPGEAFTHNGRFRVAWRAAGDWGVQLEGTWLNAGGWHQETGLVRFGSALDASPPLTTYATPSMGLWYQGEPC